MNESTPLSLDAPGAIGRRGLFRIGGLTATALALAACGKTEAGELGRIGEGATTPELEKEVVNDGVYLRTMAGISASIANAYQRMFDDGLLAVPSERFPDLGDQTDLVTLFQQHHTDAAVMFNELAVGAGAEAWECGNSRLDQSLIWPIFDRVENGAPATDSALEIEPSDDPTRDMVYLVHALESLSAESCQAMVSVLTTPELRSGVLRVGVRSGRQAALIALKINPGGYLVLAADEAATEDTVQISPDNNQGGNPGGVPTSTSVEQSEQSEGEAVGEGSTAPPPTFIPLPVAVPGQFGQLSPIIWIGGAGDENGVRMKASFETPSLNSFAYPFDSCAEG